MRSFNEGQAVDVRVRNGLVSHLQEVSVVLTKHVQNQNQATQSPLAALISLPYLSFVFHNLVMCFYVSFIECISLLGNTCWV